MKAKDIEVGGHYVANVSGRSVVVRVDNIRDEYRARGLYDNKLVRFYDVTNLYTRRSTTFRSAAKFRFRAKVVNGKPVTARDEFYAKRGLEEVTALDIVDGDIIYNNGYRCLVMHPSIDSGVARYNLVSATNDKYPNPLPVGYEGMASGGNHLAKVLREVKSTAETR
jgi:hypothetical protein